MKLFRIIGFVLLAVCVSSCAFGVFAPEQAKNYYVLDLKRERLPSPLEKTAPLTVMVQDFRANDFIDGNQIVFSTAKNTRGSYQFSFWTEAVGNKLGTLLREALEHSKIFDHVVSEDSPAFVNYVITPELNEFYFENSNPAEAHVFGKMTLSVLDIRTNKLLDQKMFEAKALVDGKEPVNVVDAFSLVTSDLMAQILTWLSTRNIS